MLVALLNTSKRHNIALSLADNDSDHQAAIQNVVFFMKTMVPARLFKILVGFEKVSAIDKVTALILNGDSNEVPCSPIFVDNTMKRAFLSQTSVNKEVLSQSLMLVVSFMDLCVHQNPKCLARLLPQRVSKS
ncbi:unnamed protein product [Callosobruchus maculatus]|uniref:Uncharacterized protein n=1 Tax=Callosobruchus maculatus TaxID=64391 RepID=A0A653DFI5_CALMS|nr:unnamed protein product [Callosobruchus maculatus]